jgi:hypothetical protein
MTVIRTAKSVYHVASVEVPANGPAVIVARSSNGRTRRLTRKDVGRPRFDAAVARFYAAQHAAMSQAA